MRTRACLFQVKITAPDTTTPTFLSFFRLYHLYSSDYKQRGREPVLTHVRVHASTIFSLSLSLLLLHNYLPWQLLQPAPEGSRWQAYDLPIISIFNSVYCELVFTFKVFFSSYYHLAIIFTSGPLLLVTKIIALLCYFITLLHRL